MSVAALLSLPVSLAVLIATVAVGCSVCYINLRLSLGRSATDCGGRVAMLEARLAALEREVQGLGNTLSDRTDHLA